MSCGRDYDGKESILDLERVDSCRSETGKVITQEDRDGNGAHELLMCEQRW